MKPDAYHVIWSGKGSLPWQEDEPAWTQRRNPLLEAADVAIRSGKTVEQIQAKEPLRPHPVTVTCACGQKYRTRIPTIRRQCDTCRRRWAA